MCLAFSDNLDMLELRLLHGLVNEMTSWLAFGLLILFFSSRIGCRSTEL